MKVVDTDGPVPGVLGVDPVPEVLAVDPVPADTVVPPVTGVPEVGPVPDVAVVTLVEGAPLVLEPAVTLPVVPTNTKTIRVLHYQHRDLLSLSRVHT